MSSSPIDYVIQEPADYTLYDNASWNDVDGFLEQSLLNEEERLEQQLQQIYHQLDEREQIHEEKVESIEDEIFRQKNRLESVQRGAGGNETQVRHRLESLYQEKWRAKQSVWQDKQDLLEEKRGLERELRELEESRDLEKIL